MCLRQRAKLWRERAEVECRKASRTWFGTLSLRPDEHYRALLCARVGTGSTAAEEFAARNRMIQKWITLWVKRVRAESGARIRILVVCEAHKSGLPHYHALIHECSPSERVRERTLRGQWPHGFSMFKLVNPAKGSAVGYVCKYLSKSNLARVRASVRYGELRPHDKATPAGVRVITPDPPQEENINAPEGPEGATSERKRAEGDAGDAPPHLGAPRKQSDAGNSEGGLSYGLSNGAEARQGGLQAHEFLQFRALLRPPGFQEGGRSGDGARQRCPGGCCRDGDSG